MNLARPLFFFTKRILILMERSPSIFLR